MTIQNTNHQRVLKLVGDLGQHSENAFKIALAFVIEELKAKTSEEKLSMLPKALLTKLLNALPQSSERKAGAVTVSNAKPEGRKITLQGSQAIEIHVQVNGRTVRAVLSNASFNKGHDELRSYAKGLGGRLATREENCAVAKYLLEKEKKETLNQAEAKLLHTYRYICVRDSEGGIGVDSPRFSFKDYSYSYADFPWHGALFVLPRGEAPITQNEQLAAVGITPRELKELEPSDILSSVENLKNTTGVVIVGEKEADKAGVPIPERYSEKALLAKDPYDPSKTMAQSYGLGFDAETKSWLLVRLSVIPGSLGLNRNQRMALPQHEVAGLKTSIPSTESESIACYRVMDAIVKSGQGNPLPLKGVYAATDWESVPGCRFVFGYSDARGVYSGAFCYARSGAYFNGSLTDSRVGAFSLAN
jgi:hypothetical protein